MPIRRLPLRSALAAFAVFAVLIVPQAAQAQSGSGCTKVAAPTGSDSASGSETEPFETLEQLVDSLGTGEVGCLRAGTYGGDDVYFEAPRAQLRSYPGEVATITAFMEVKPEAVGAHIHHLRFDGSQHSNNTGVKLQADRTIFSDNELTKGGEGICLLAGSYNPAHGIVIERNRIYDCGPSSSKLMHQLYLQNTRGAVVRWNILNGNGGGWGVHLYTNADDSVIEHNIIDGNKGGVIYAGNDGDTSDRNIVRNNAITYSAPRWNIEGSWSDEAPGTGNTAHHNCVTPGTDEPTGIADEEGFSATSNTTIQSSPYVNRQRGDYRFAPGNPCAAMVGDVAGVVAGVTNPPPPARPAAKQRRRVGLSLHASKRRVAPKRRVRLSGRLAGVSAAPGTRVVLQIRQNGRWRGFQRAELRTAGHFSTKVRAGRSKRARVSRMRAVVPGVAHSRTIRLKIRP
jgi:hypothetical protein